MNFVYHKKSELPPLAWLAVVTKGADVVEVNCGDAVVTSDEWFAAGVWDGELDRGEFDTCSTSCCTGMKISQIGDIGGG